MQENFVTREDRRKLLYEVISNRGLNIELNVVDFVVIEFWLPVPLSSVFLQHGGGEGERQAEAEGGQDERSAPVSLGCGAEEDAEGEHPLVLSDLICWIPPGPGSVFLGLG